MAPAWIPAREPPLGPPGLLALGAVLGAAASQGAGTLRRRTRQADPRAGPEEALAGATAHRRDRRRAQRRKRGLGAHYPDPRAEEDMKFLPPPREVLREDGESVEWVNMAVRKAWQIYQRRLEQWIQKILQPPITRLVDRSEQELVTSLEISEFSLDYRPPVLRNMTLTGSRKDSDIAGVVDVRYTGGAKALLLLELGAGNVHPRLRKLPKVQVPIVLTDLDFEGKVRFKTRLAPLSPYIGTLTFAFVGAPSIRVRLAPYNRIQLMNIPVIQGFLTELLTVNLPGLMVQPKRMEINIPPAVTAVAEAAVGRDAVMAAVASAVMQVEAVEQGLLGSVLPLDKQDEAGGVRLPDRFKGELAVGLRQARGLPVQAFPFLAVQSNPYCTLRLGMQQLESKRAGETGRGGSRGCPQWNQDFQILVQDPMAEVLEVDVRDMRLTGQPDLGTLRVPLMRLKSGASLLAWHGLEDKAGVSRGAVLLELTYKPFYEDPVGSYDEGQGAEGAVAASSEAAPAPGGGHEEAAIEDFASAAAASASEGVAQTKAAQALAVTKAAAARAAVKAGQAAKAVIVDPIAARLSEDPGADKAGEGAASATVSVSEVTVAEVMAEVEERMTKGEADDADAERRAVAKSERPWLQLVSILTVTVISILTVVAYRLDILISIGLAEPK